MLTPYMPAHASLAMWHSHAVWQEPKNTPVLKELRESVNTEQRGKTGIMVDLLEEEGTELNSQKRLWGNLRRNQ